MVLSQLGEENADAFLRCLYDWNPYAAAYALTDANTAVRGPSAEMQVVMFAMLAEKRFDIVGPTRERASDALAIVNGAFAEEIRASKTMPQLFATLGTVKSDKRWYNDGVTLFTHPSDKEMADEDLDRIRVEDSIVGWTIANVARRVPLTGPQLVNLRSWHADGSPVVRWRVAHVLGAHAIEANALVLSGLLANDNDADVKYGAVRSLVEVAARTKDVAVRQRVEETLIGTAPAVATQRKVKDELRRAMLIVPDAAPPSWLDFISAVSKSIYLAEDDLKEREVWKRYIDLASARFSSTSAS
jgi:hypothetical protein